MLLLDGVEVPTNMVATLVGEKLEYVQYSKLYHCNTQTEVASHMKRVAINREE